MADNTPAVIAFGVAVAIIGAFWLAKVRGKATRDSADQVIAADRVAAREFEDRDRKQPAPRSRSNEGLLGMDLTECNARREWARKHLATLREAVREYEQSDPYEIRQERTSTGYESSLYITPKPVPMEISFMAGDVLHNLRSTLDHLAWQLALTTGDPSPAFPLGGDPDSESWRRVLFPLRSKPPNDDSDSWLPERLRNVRPEIKAFLREIQPFAMADDPRHVTSTLWMLQELSNVDKHRVPLIAVPSLHETATLTVTTPLSRVNSRVLEHAVVPRMLEGETLLVRVGFDTVPLSKPHLEWEHGIWVAFHDSLGIGLGMPVVDTLDAMEAMVAHILIRAKRIGATEAAP